MRIIIIKAILLETSALKFILHLRWEYTLPACPILRFEMFNFSERSQAQKDGESRL